jgi:glutamate dehydrogenase
MRDRLRNATEALRARGDAAEATAFLEWLRADNFTLLGYRELALVHGDDHDVLHPVDGTGLGLLRDQRAPGDSVKLRGRARDEARSATPPIIITKTSERSTVHRPAPLDHIAVKELDDEGRPALERRFLGLFTSTAYNDSPHDIPLLRGKIARVMKESALDPQSHRGKSLHHILTTLPRDDLFQASIAELEAIGQGLLGLQERQRVRLFLRREAFGRFYRCLVYLPRERYNERSQRAIERILVAGTGGSSVESDVTISESALARIAATIATGAERLAEPDVETLRAEIEDAVRSWTDRLRSALLAKLAEERALELLHRYGTRFSPGYQDEVDAERASCDIMSIVALEKSASGLEMALAAESAEPAASVRFTTFRRGEPIPLYAALPVLENLGFKVLSEHVYDLDVPGAPIFIQDFELETDDGRAVDAAELGVRLKPCFASTLRGEVENDGFNRFVVSAGLDCRQCALLRAFAKYLLQTGTRYSAAYMQEVLGRYPRHARALVEKFAALFDVDRADEERAASVQKHDAVQRKELDRAGNLDDDRILRSFGALVDAVLRTNFYQHEPGSEPKPYVSFKLDPRTLLELPRPKPMFEIFVYSQRVEGVHLRAAKIARGGIRWSDRREDFRTEVLGLMKAQQVKNTVIVPSGAKGGFVCKALPPGGREAVQHEVVECYKTFIRGLLDLTDNLVAGEVHPPPRAVRRDDNDPYLVVAADKGTASFSDIANSLSAEYGFWLGDAFASGGSAGYDHKKMAITARGAWEAVKRHFRELGINTQTEAFTVAGIGDMSGDVFGNGMLRSPHLRLVAAFDHRHIFLDPDPDPEKSFAERQRLFGLPRSRWDDYDRAALSPGGGIYSRQSKVIELSPEAQARLEVKEAKLSPPELISAILKAPVDLLWNGGIGTYVKASSEPHTAANDPGNDALRVDGRELRCRVVGEGGNLGFTQRGRIEFAEHGGRINTDFIDNSGGVDCSDREVNIKILLDDAIRRGALPAAQRNGLLAAMTDDVAGLVLADNYAQTQVLSIMESRAAERLGEDARLIRVLETQGLLDRALEFLPSEEELAERRAAKRGLTRPELAIVLSYAKIELIRSLEETDIPEDPYLGTELETYFPRQLRTPIGGLIRKHRLAREIIAMLIGGSMINRMGPFFVLRAEDETGANVAQIARAYAIVREVFGVRRLWREIEALDYKVDSGVQYDSIFKIGRVVRRAVYWFLQNYPHDLDIEHMVMRFRTGVGEVLDRLHKLLVGRDAERYAEELERCRGVGLPQELAERIAALGTMTQILDVVELAREFRLPATEVGAAHFALAAELELDVLREHIDRLEADNRWRAMARTTLRESLAREQRALLRGALAAARGSSVDDALAKWLEKHANEVASVQHTFDDMLASAPLDSAAISVPLNEMGKLGRASHAGSAPQQRPSTRSFTRSTSVAARAAPSRRPPRVECRRPPRSA